MTIDKKSAKKAKKHTVYKNKNGTRVPGVTTITGVMNKRALLFWANKIGLEGIKMNEYVDDLAGAGTCAHAMIETHIRNILDDADEETDTNQYSKDQVDRAENSYLKYLEWEQAQEITYKKSEIQVVSEAFQFGGTADIVAELNGRLTLIDIKTSKAVYDDQFTQVAGYNIALAENGYDIESTMIVRVGRNETEGFEAVYIPAVDLHRERFLACKRLYDLNKQIKKQG